MHDSLQRMLSRGAGALKVRGQCVLRLAGGDGTRLACRHVAAILALSLIPAHHLLQALISGFSSALLALLLLGVDSSPAQAHATLELRKCGAGDLVGEVASLAMELIRLAAVSEAVAAPWYDTLSSDLL